MFFVEATRQGKDLQRHPLRVLNAKVRVLEAYRTDESECCTELLWVASVLVHLQKRGELPALE